MAHSKGLQLDQCNKQSFSCPTSTTLPPQPSSPSCLFGQVKRWLTHLSTQFLSWTREITRCTCICVRWSLGRRYTEPSTTHSSRLFFVVPATQPPAYENWTLGLLKMGQRTPRAEHINSHEFRDFPPGLSTFQNLWYLSLHC